MIIRVKDESGNFVILPLGGGDVSQEQIAQAVEEYLNNNQLISFIQTITVDELDSVSPLLNTGVYKISSPQATSTLKDSIFLVSKQLITSTQIRLSSNGCYIRKSVRVEAEVGYITQWGPWYELATVHNLTTGYYTKTEVDNLINSAIGEALEGDY